MTAQPSTAQQAAFDEDDLLPLSALQHLVFCPRQCALIHLEQTWSENRLTVEGRHLHERADQPLTESRGELRIARAVRLRSLRLGLAGQADTVEFHRVAAEAASAPAPSAGVALPGVDGRWQPAPVEYKHGRPKPDRCDEVQLCAQALCLEEMLGAAIPAGAIFYGQPRRRLEVAFSADLRAQTEALATRLHELIRSGTTPPARYERKCQSCSLLEECLPKPIGAQRSAGRYLAQTMAEMLADAGPAASPNAVEEAGER